MSEGNDHKAESRTITSVSTITILKVFAVLLGLYFIYIIRDIILLLLISMILSAAITPLVEWLYSRLRFPRGLTVVLVYFVFLGLAVIAGMAIVPRLISEVAALGKNIEGFRKQFEIPGSQLYSFLNNFGLNDTLTSIGSTLAGLTSNIFQKTLGVFSGIFDTITVLVISFYLVIEQNGLKDFVKSLTPPKYHTRIASTVYKVQRRLGKWLLGQIALMASIFALTYFGLMLLKVENALSLALFAGLLEVIPYLGPIISVIPAVFVALLQSPILAVMVIVLYIVIQQAENYLLVPKILGKSIGANPLIILIALLVGYNIAGIIGVLISAPIVAVVTVVMEEYGGYRKITEEVESGSS